MSDDLLNAALAFIRAGVSIIPIDHTTKRPAAYLLPIGPDGKPTWKPFQQKIADEATMRRWFASGLHAFAVVCGKVSGGLLVLDFDVPRFFGAWYSESGDLLEGLPRQKTGGGGYQVLLRCPDPDGNDKLAWMPSEEEPSGRTIAIETRGEGGYAVVAPSWHPSGKRYEVLTGPALTSIPTVSQARADALLMAARKLDEAPHTRQEMSRIAARASAEHQSRTAHRNGHGGVIDAFKRAHSVESMLERFGYTKGTGGRYVRPGGDSESVSVLEGRSFHWSSDDPLNDGRVVSGCGVHDAFDLFTYFGHGGDVTAAVKSAAKQLGLHGAPRGNGTKTPRNGRTIGGFADGGGGNPVPVSVRRIEPYLPFPVEVLPPVVAKFVKEAAQALGCDPAYVALPLLTMLAGAIGNTRRIRLKSSWTEPPVLWTVVVADCGTLKSPAFDLALRAVRQRQKRAMKDYDRAKAEYQAAKEQYDADVKNWRKATPGERGDRPEEPERPVCERLWCSDTTVEALADRLSLAPRGLLLARDELSGWLSSFNQYKAGQGGDVAHWLEMHRAGHLLVDRKTGDKTTIYVPRAAVSITGGIQPDTLRRCLTPEFFANGLAARLLVAMPPGRTKRWTDAELDGAVMQGIVDAHATLLMFQPSTDLDGDPEPVDVDLTDGAKALWVEFYNNHAQEQAELGQGALAAAWSKLEGYAARLALVVHCIRQASGEAVDPWHVDEQSIAAGTALAEWFGREARRVYAAMAESTEERERRKLMELVQRLGGQASARDLGKRSRRYRDDAELARADLQGLVDAGLGHWERPAPGAQGGRPREVFVLDLNGSAPNVPDGVGETPGVDARSGGFGDADDAGDEATSR